MDMEIDDNTSKVQWSNSKIVKNLAILSLGIMLLFTGYAGIYNLQSTINNENGIGVTSVAVIFASICISSLLLPKIMIRKCGLKTTLLLSFISYCPYIAANFYISWYTMLTSALLLGTASPTLWVSYSTYLNRLTRLYHKNNPKETLASIVAMVFGISGLLYMSTFCWGNLVSYLVLRSNGDQIDIRNTSSHKQAMCGIEFAVDDSTTNGHISDLNAPPFHLRYIMTSIYVTCGVASVLLIALFLDNLEGKKSVSEIPDSMLNDLTATMNHVRNRNQMRIIPLTVYIGILQGFYFGDFAKEYVACAWGIYHVGLVSIAYGLAGALSSGLSGRIVKYFKRPTVFIIAAVVNIAIFIELFLWRAETAPKSWFLVIAGATGVVIGMLWSQVKAYHGFLFPKNEEAAFANFTFWNGIGNCLTFSYSAYLSTAAKIYILIVVFTIGFIGYAWTEICIYRSKLTDHKEECTSHVVVLKFTRASLF